MGIESTGRENKNKNEKQNQTKRTQVTQMVSYWKQPRFLKQQSLRAGAGAGVGEGDVQSSQALYLVLRLAMCLFEIAILGVDASTIKA